MKLPSSSKHHGVMSNNLYLSTGMYRNVCCVVFHACC